MNLLVKHMESSNANTPTYSITPAGKKIYVGPVYHRDDAEVTSTAIFPLAYFGKNHTANTSTSFDGGTATTVLNFRGR